MKRTQQLLVCFAFITAVLLSHDAFAQPGITVNGTTHAINSSTGALSFGSNNLTTTGAINAQKMSVMGSSVTMPGLVTDNNVHLLQIDQNGNVTAVSTATLSTVLYPYSYTSDPCGSTTATAWGVINGGHPQLLTNSGCTYVGIDVPTATADLEVGGDAIIDNDFFAHRALAIGPDIGTDAALTIKSNFQTLMEAYSYTTGNPIFTLDKLGNGYFGGNLGIGTTTPNAALGIYLPATDFGDNIPAFSITSENYPVFTVMNTYGTYSPQGVVGIGTNNPIGVLQVVEPLAVFTPPPYLLTLTNTVPQDVFLVDPGGDTYIAGVVVIDGGEIYHAPPQNQYGLTVGGVNAGLGGTILCSEIKVCLSGCDFVFGDDYKLMPLNQLEDYLKLNHHLPGIASAKEMANSDGVALGKMNSQLLQKVEELTLYTIDLKKQLDEMQAEIAKMKEGK